MFQDMEEVLLVTYERILLGRSLPIVSLGMEIEVKMSYTVSLIPNSANGPFHSFLKVLK